MTRGMRLGHQCLGGLRPAMVGGHFDEFDPTGGAVDEHMYVVNPEAVGDPEQTPVVYVPPSMRRGMYELVNVNRRSLGLPPQEVPSCTCPHDDPWQRDCPLHGED